MSVSVVIPVHNSIKYMDACISSVLTQLGDDDEILLVENGSVDRTPQKCEQYTNKYEQIKYIQLGDVGVSVARNEGVKVAKGTWITFLDSDDKLLAGAIEILRNASVQDTDLIICGYSDSENILPEKSEFVEVENLLLVKALLRYPKYKRAIAERTPIDDYNKSAAWGKFYKKDFLLKHEIEFPKGIRLSEDAVFSFKAYYHAKTVYATKQKIYFYRPNENSVSRKYNKNLFDNNLSVIRYFEAFRSSFPKTREWNENFASFYVSKLLLIYKEFEILMADKAVLFKEITSEKHLKWSVKKCPLFNVISGKKNSLLFVKRLLRLRKQLKCYKQTQNKG